MGLLAAILPRRVSAVDQKNFTRQSPAAFAAMFPTRRIGQRRTVSALGLVAATKRGIWLILYRQQLCLTWRPSLRLAAHWRNRLAVLGTGHRRIVSTRSRRKHALDASFCVGCGNRLKSRRAGSATRRLVTAVAAIVFRGRCIPTLRTDPSRSISTQEILGALWLLCSALLSLAFGASGLADAYPGGDLLEQMREPRVLRVAWVPLEYRQIGDNGRWPALLAVLASPLAWLADWSLALRSQEVRRRPKISRPPEPKSAHDIRHDYVEIALAVR
jgi:hypothetical protein